MLPKKVALIVFGLCYFLSAEAQSAAWRSFFNEDAISECSIDLGDSAMSEIALTVNLARKYPQDFLELCRWYAKSAGYSDNRYMQSLETQLTNQKPLDLIDVDPELSDFALRHAKDLGRSGGTGHKSSGGQSYSSRIDNMLRHYQGMGEVCYYGDDPAWAMVVELVIDDGVRSLGHRENIFTPEYRLMGIGLSAHRVYGQSCVIEFAY